MPSRLTMYAPSQAKKVCVSLEKAKEKCLSVGREWQDRSEICGYCPAAIKFGYIIPFDITTDEGACMSFEVIQQRIEKLKEECYEKNGGRIGRKEWVWNQWKRCERVNIEKAPPTNRHRKYSATADGWAYPADEAG